MAKMCASVAFCSSPIAAWLWSTAAATRGPLPCSASIASARRGIGGTHLQLEGAALHREPVFEHLQSGLLVAIKRELMMQHLVKRRTGLLGLRQQCAPDKDTADRCQEGEQGAQDNPLGRGHGSPISNAEGARGRLRRAARARQQGLPSRAARHRRSRYRAPRRLSHRSRARLRARRGGCRFV